MPDPQTRIAIERFRALFRPSMWAAPFCFWFGHQWRVLNVHAEDAKGEMCRDCGHTRGT